jgi:hypothetical protein
VDRQGNGGGDKLQKIGSYFESFPTIETWITICYKDLNLLVIGMDWTFKIFCAILF